MAKGSEALVSGLMAHARKKGKTVDLGAKGSFKIRHPGALRAKAHAAGESTREFAQSHSKGTGVTARQSRAAIGLMAMHHGR